MARGLNRAFMPISLCPRAAKRALDVGIAGEIAALGLCQAFEYRGVVFHRYFERSAIVSRDLFQHKRCIGLPVRRQVFDLRNGGFKGFDHVGKLTWARIPVEQHGALNLHAPTPHVHKVTLKCRCRRHDWADQMRAALIALAAFEVAVRG